MDKIRHIGTILCSTPTGVKVRILQQEACGVCAARKLCNSAEAKVKDIDIKCASSTFDTGQRVVIEAPLRVGLKAVWWAYVYPLVYLLGTVFVAKAFGAEDAIAAMFGLLAVALAMLTLYIRRDRMRQQFAFHIVETLTN